MDPDATLLALLDALADGDADAALDAITHLGGWIAQGGYLPCDPRPTTVGGGQ